MGLNLFGIFSNQCAMAIMGLNEQTKIVTRMDRTYSYQKKQERMNYLLHLIKKGSCLSLEEVAERMEVSRRTLERTLKELREEGHNIVYSKELKRYKLIDD